VAALLYSKVLERGKMKICEREYCNKWIKCEMIRRNGKRVVKKDAGNEREQ